MEFKNKVRKICDAMGTYHDCNLELKKAFGKNEHIEIFEEIGGFLECEKNVRFVKDEIFYFIVEELEYLYETEIRIIDFLIEYPTNITDMVNAVFDGDYDKAIEIWNVIKNEVSEYASKVNGSE